MATDFDHLKFVLSQFSDLSEEDIELSRPLWHLKTYAKGDFFNAYQQVCQHLGFILEGAFRGYLIDQESGDEKNIFLYARNGFIVSFRSFINQAPCDYHTQVLVDAKVLCISFDSLQKLYASNHRWERFGRLMAQEAFNVALDRVESFVIQSPEQRYLKLIEQHPDICNTIPLQHISSYLGIQGPSLSRIRKRISEKKESGI